MSINTSQRNISTPRSEMSKVHSDQHQKNLSSMNKKDARKYNTLMQRCQNYVEEGKEDQRLLKNKENWIGEMLEDANEEVMLSI